ncbi:hypothetical protein [Massilia pseudoviolaceinigra]|nr:hypothetical protein [Massilia sp. CCM 9206]MDQ1924713.1 hypothetical protein [Massilia sp. CCM 9206]
MIISPSMLLSRSPFAPAQQSAALAGAIDAASPTAGLTLTGT